MKKKSIICICQIYNELEKGNLARFFAYIKPLVDAVVVYDDGSTDGSFEYALKQTPHAIRGARNDFANEINHKQQLLTKALELKPDFILWLDADEVLSAGAAFTLPKLCQQMITYNLDGISLHEINIWRSHSWQRLDSMFDIGWFVRLWRVQPGMTFGKARSRLHQKQYPSTLKMIEKREEIKVLHYGFATEKNLAYKYLTYRQHGQRGYDMLDRLISEEKLKLAKIPPQLFPKGLYQDDTQPAAMPLIESLAYVAKYRDQVCRPKYSIFCLIYKSVEWLQFAYEQVLRYTDMQDTEFYFVANDADPKVLAYLTDNYIPHYVWNNTVAHKQEWYINNVYRAWNYGAQVARGDFLVFINSDMGFTPQWFDNLLQAYDGSNCVTARLVESGKMRSGQYGIEKNFGRKVYEYRESDFQRFAASLSTPGVENGGLYMPLLIRKDQFLRVGGYPEGNTVPGSNIFKPKIAKPGEPCTSGDVVLMAKLAKYGIKHQTAFNSIVYHFQEGEMDSNQNSKLKTQNAKLVAVVNDLVTGTLGEKVLWDFLLAKLPQTYGVDTRLVGSTDFAAKAQAYAQHNYPETRVIIQNATFIDPIDKQLFTIAFLQDDLRAMGKRSAQQEKNLKHAHKLVTNSLHTALSYPEYDFAIIPIGVDEQLFKPLPKAKVRKELGFGKERIGIFVGNFTTTKGWPLVKKCIKNFPDIHWLLVTKDDEEYKAPNVTVYQRISQTQLVKLLNSSDFFILGSPVETECLAALEACLCDVPVIMKNVGIFKEFTEVERRDVGIFSDDFIASIQRLPQHKFTPRKIIIQKNLTVSATVKQWQRLISESLQQIKIAEVKNMSVQQASWLQKLLHIFHGA